MLGNHSHVLTYIDAPWNAGGPNPPKVFCVDGKEIKFRFNPPIPFPMSSINLTLPYVYPPNYVPNDSFVAVSDFDRASSNVRMVQSGVMEATGWTPTFNDVWALLWSGAPLPPQMPEELEP